MMDDEGYWYILGRSDDTIKVAGKRLGPAEVESAAVASAGVAEAAAIGVPDPLKGEHVVVFCVPRAGSRDDEALREAVEAAITRALGKALKPERVLFVRPQLAREPVEPGRDPVSSVRVRHGACK
jgi:acetyl-CoA synthetase